MAPDRQQHLEELAGDVQVEHTLRLEQQRITDRERPRGKRERRRPNTAIISELAAIKDYYATRRGA